jgi:hypothetical protein
MTMFQKLRNHLSYANVAATMALVFALTGGAVAATSHSGGGSPSKATASVTPVATVAAKKKSKVPARGPAGPKGATGAAGPAGAAGPVGATGPGGLQGPAGTNGTNGTGTQGEKGEKGEAGAAGESVKNKAYTGSECPEGGSEFKVGTKTPTYACNGEKGVIHPGNPVGSPETLAPEATETGTWSFGNLETNGIYLLYPVASFAIPLANPLPEADVHYINADKEEVLGGGKPNVTPSLYCTGTAEKPTAAPGNFCVFAAGEEHVTSNREKIYQSGSESKQEGAGTTGAIENFEVTGSDGEEEAWGTWAVTAPAA